MQLGLKGYFCALHQTLSLFASTGIPWKAQGVGQTPSSCEDVSDKSRPGFLLMYVLQETDSGHQLKWGGSGCVSQEEALLMMKIRGICACYTNKL